MLETQQQRVKYNSAFYPSIIHLEKYYGINVTTLSMVGVGKVSW